MVLLEEQNIQFGENREFNPPFIIYGLNELNWYAESKLVWAKSPLNMFGLLIIIFEIFKYYLKNV